LGSPVAVGSTVTAMMPLPALANDGPAIHGSAAATLPGSAMRSAMPAAPLRGVSVNRSALAGCPAGVTVSPSSVGAVADVFDALPSARASV